MDRYDTDIFKMQYNFIDFLLSPLYEAFCAAFPKNALLQLCLQNTRHNRKCWAQLADKWSFDGDKQDAAEAQLHLMLSLDVNEFLSSGRRDSSGSFISPASPSVTPSSTS
eukprot:EC690208.1.p2 GENE.EC690208.1~~EC690208.1.p2  ORF type:complete len:125 (-),score=24.02 EC690208.1:218-547(-)